MLKKISVIIVLFVAAYRCDAQVTFGSIDDIWKYADNHNITIQTARFEVAKARLAKQQAIGPLLPQASAFGSFTDNTALQTTLIPAQIFGGPAGAYQAVVFGQKYIYVGSFSASLDIVNLQSWFNLQIAKKTEELNRSSLASTRKSIYQQLATNYYSYLLMKEAAKLALRDQLITDSVYQSTANKFKEGTVSQINLNTSKINLERSQQSYLTAEYQMSNAANNLKILLGMSADDSLMITAELSGEEVVAEDEPFSEDPSIKNAYYQAQVSLSQYRYAKSAFVPTLSVQYYNATQQNDNKYEPFATGANWYPQQYWSVRLNVPLFTGGSRYFQAKRNKVAYEENMTQYHDAIRQSALNDENTRLAYMKASAVVQKAEDVMNLAFDNYMHTSYRYEAGIAPEEDKLNAFKDYIDYKNQYLNSLSDKLVQLYQVKIRQQNF